MLSCRALVLSAVSTAMVISLASREALAANEPAAPVKAPEAAADSKAADGAKEATPVAPAKKEPLRLVPKRTDHCGLTGPRAEAPLLNSETFAYDRTNKVVTTILDNGAYLWADLHDCEQHAVVAKIVMLNGPKSTEAKAWLKMAAQVSSMLKGPLLEDAVEAVEKIAADGKWFSRRTKGGIAYEFPMAKEYVRFHATITDSEDMTILTLVQDAP